MERLTFLNGDEISCVRNDQCFEEQSEHYCGPAIDRLAAYEGTGLTPEEITAMRHTLEEYHRTADPLLSAKAQGRVVVLPCKVGNTLYEVTGRKTISEYQVKAIRVELFGLFIEWEIEKGFVWQSLAGITPDEIGETVFLTREDAEKALEGMRND